MGNILIADDDQTCRDSMRKVLEKEGHTVLATEGVDAALEALGTRSFDLVVCDCRMPGKTGIDFLKELRKQGAQVPVLMMSAYADARTESKVFELGALRLLHKPIKRRELIEQTSKIVGS
jgi:two-component system response regulator PilR (NtrC family)